MGVMRIKVGDTPTVVKYRIAKSGIKLIKVVALNHKANGKWAGVRPISLDIDTQKQMIEIIGQEIVEIKKGDVLR